VFDGATSRAALALPKTAAMVWLASFGEKAKVGPGVAEANVANQIAKQVHVRWQETLFHVAAKQVAQQAAEILMA
jgi:hypothetical protein